ncbi:protein fmp52 [Sporothrix brasiliensis 5110]|uniref:Protein fmp52 n=1 Tax=Sporothrix brasiliensis 5110 TaxID=1398154 RepID=A0A0C2EPM2_9PEZI|nr:protein fmp52 [Sporothrix brasiliensis 5110]KIH88184.1 protein fmp52 [Sporothrix brasiliensis 5110]
MASSPITSAVFGATGLVGSHLVTALLGLDAFGTVHTITRRAPKQADDATLAKKLDAVVEKDTEQWAPKFKEAAAAGAQTVSTVFSSLGTTRAAAGGIANQWKIDHDLNVEIARAAKAAGVKTFVFVSSAGTRSLLARSLPYSKMKNGVEDTIKELGFEQAIVLKPGLILGDREVEHQGAGVFKALVGASKTVSQAWHDSMAQDADVIAKAAAHAALLASQGKAPSAYWVIETNDIVRLGRDDWKF